MTALSGKKQTKKKKKKKRRNTEHRSTEGQRHRRIKTPKSHETSYTSLRQNIISFCCRVMPYWYIISLLLCDVIISLLSCDVILIYHIALIHHIILIYLLLISYTLITIIHHPGIISHHTDIMSWWYIVWYHIIQYWYFNCWYNNIIHTYIYIYIYIYIYRSHGNNLRYQNWYYVGTKFGAIELKVFQMVTEFRV